MNLLPVFTIIGLFVYTYGCVTPEALTVVDGHVLGIAMELDKLEAITFDFLAGTAELNVPELALLDTMCNVTEIKQNLQEIHNYIAACPQLLNNSTGLQTLDFEGVDMAALFTDFADIDSFCDCRSPVAAAWVIRASKDHLQQENTGWFYNATADVNAVCSNEVLKYALVQFGATSAECQTAMETQLDLTTVEEKLKIQSLVKLAGTALCIVYSNEIMDCIDTTASDSSVHFCLNWASSLTTDKQTCGKRVCMTTYVGECGTEAVDLHIAAVNVEHFGEIADTSDVCQIHTDLTCVDIYDLETVNAVVETITQYLNQYISDGAVEKDSIPAVLNMFCNESGFLPAIREIETLTSQCQALNEISNSFHRLNIKLWRVKDLYNRLSSIDTFCRCRHELVQAWNLQDEEETWTFTDQQAHFSTIANIPSICGTEQTQMVGAIVNAQDECKRVLEEEAGFSSSRNPTSFSEFHDLINTCNSSTDVMSDWNCTNSIASSNEFTTCVTDAETGEEQRALCGKNQCVITEMQECGATAQELYIKAVNMENVNGIKESYDGCDGANGVCLPFVVLIACCFLSILQYSDHCIIHCITV